MAVRPRGNRRSQLDDSCAAASAGTAPSAKPPITSAPPAAEAAATAAAPMPYTSPHGKSGVTAPISAACAVGESLARAAATSRKSCAIPGSGGSRRRRRPPGSITASSSTAAISHGSARERPSGTVPPSAPSSPPMSA